MAAASGEVHPQAAIVGEKIITNASFTDRIADLTRGKVNSFIIGWSHNNGRNQVFNFEPQGRNTDKIALTAADGTEYHVASPNPAPMSGSHLKATVGGVGSVYTVVGYAPGQVKLSILSADGMAPLYWTAKISLELDNGTANQVWGVVDPDN